MHTRISSVSRRSFLAWISSATAGGLLVPAVVIAQTQGQPVPQPSQQPPARPPQLPPDLVNEFVRMAHGNLDRTQELLESQPALLNATWDWGGGDWETGLGGASHMGRKDIASFLIGQGARMDIFAAAMLGRVDIVKGMLEAFPNLLHAKGPHGIPLMAHAKSGGEEAASVVALLESLGVAG